MKNLNIKSTRQNIELVCEKHGKFNVLVFNHMKGTHCKKCKSSSGEELIINFLDKNKIEYNYQHSFSECSYKRNLKFDFYIEDKNTCIEYDGEQHFVPVDVFGGEESFNIQKKLDNIKNFFCEERDIKLIRISYFEKENINDILSFLI
jgi:predicted component of viral defense system (DUF524 family)